MFFSSIYKANFDSMRLTISALSEYQQGYQKNLLNSKFVVLQWKDPNLQIATPDPGELAVTQESQRFGIRNLQPPAPKVGLDGLYFKNV